MRCMRGRTYFSSASQEMGALAPSAPASGFREGNWAGRSGRTPAFRPAWTAGTAIPRSAAVRTRRAATPASHPGLPRAPLPGRPPPLSPPSESPTLVRPALSWPLADPWATAASPIPSPRLSPVLVAKPNATSHALSVLPWPFLGLWSNTYAVWGN